MNFLLQTQGFAGDAAGTEFIPCPYGPALLLICSAYPRHMPAISMANASDIHGNCHEMSTAPGGVTRGRRHTAGKRYCRRGGPRPHPAGYCRHHPIKHSFVQAGKLHNMNFFVPSCPSSVGTFLSISDTYLLDRQNSCWQMRFVCQLFTNLAARKQ